MTTPDQGSQSKSPSSLPVPEAAVSEALPVPPPPTDEAPGTTAVFQPCPVVPADLDERLAFAEQTHQYIREYIRLADQKAAFFFTACTALLAFLYRVNASARWLRPVLEWSVIDAAAFVAMFALGVSAVTSLIVVIPRTPGSRRGYLFWEAIAEYETSRKYADDLASVPLPDLLQIKAEHSHDLAKVCRAKYRALRAALRIGTVGLGAAVVVFLFAH